MHCKKFMKISGPQEGWSNWVYLRKSDGITEMMALDHLKEQVKNNQMNLNHQRFQMREQFLQRHGNLRRTYVPQTENSFVRPPHNRPDGVWEERRLWKAGFKVMKGFVYQAKKFLKYNWVFLISLTWISVSQLFSKYLCSVRQQNQHHLETC